MKILKNKRGIVFENAIIFMLVIFSLCFILTTSTVINHYQAQNEINTLKRKVYLDQVGEYFLEYLDNNTDNDFNTYISSYVESSLYGSNYTYEVIDNTNNDNTFTLKITSRNSEDILLWVTVMIQNIVNDGGYLTDREIINIQCWSYGDPS